MTNKHVDVTKMSTETGISVELIKLGLGLPLEGSCSATTAKEAQTLYHHQKPEAKVLILQTWNELSKKEVEAAVTLKEVKDAYHASPHGSRIRIVALYKWISLALTVTDIRGAYDASPCNSKAQRLAVKKWNKLSKKEVEAGVTLEEVKATYYTAPEGSEAQAIALYEWIRLVTTPGEATEAYHVTGEDTKAQRLACQIWNELSKKEVEAAITLEEVQAAYYAAPNDSEAKTLALKKLGDFYTSHS